MMELGFENELNQDQQAVVTQGDGYFLVLAGAGSGKTRVVTYRVAYLLRKGVKPENILLVTFTNKAAAEMVKRVTGLTGQNQKEKIVLPWAGTFHHIAYKILRQEAGVLGYSSNFTILDADDSQTLIKGCIKNLRVDTVGQKFPSANVVQGIISYARNADTTIEDVLEMKYPSWFRWIAELKEIASEYEKKKRQANVMDFDDLLVNLNLLLNQPEILRKYAEQFHYILVDEYQDTNRIQAEIVKKLSTVHKNLLVVGDDAQSIYSFRAAEIENILNFEKDFPQAKIAKLETNYRSSQEILSLANAVIANNINQYRKKLKTIFQSGLKPELRPLADQESEADFVVRKIEELLQQENPPHEIAVLFRAARHSQQLEMALAQANIAYDFRGGMRFFERAHIKDTLAYLRLLNNPTDEAAWHRVLLKEEGIGPMAAERIVAEVRRVSLQKEVDRKEIEKIGFDLLNERAKVGWNNFVKIFQAASAAKQPAEMVRAILEAGYDDYLQKEYLDAEDRAGDVEQLVIYAGKFDDLAEFLAQANLTEDYGQKVNAKKVSANKKIVLSTVHQAKGLEWSSVFLINLNNGAFPNSRALREDGGLEEERRLFYVAVTRAKKNLFLSYPMEGGGWGDAYGPSLFLEEIDEELLDDKSLLKTRRSVSLNDPIAGVEYVDEEAPIKIKPGFLLRDIDDL